MVRHTLKILQQMLQNFTSVSNHYGALCIKGLIIVANLSIADACRGAGYASEILKFSFRVGGESVVHSTQIHLQSLYAICGEFSLDCDLYLHRTCISAIGDCNETWLLLFIFIINFFLH